MFKHIPPFLRFIDAVEGDNGGGSSTTDDAGTPTIEDLQAALTAAQADADKWKGLSRKHEAAAKAKPAATPAASGGDDTTASAIEEIRRELAAAKRDAVVARIAAAKGVPAALLAGYDDEDALNDAADALLAFAKGAKPATAANDASASGKTGDAIGDAKGAITSRDQLSGMSAADILKLRDEGKLDGLLGKK